jgi:hypothetical protein
MCPGEPFDPMTTWSENGPPSAVSPPGALPSVGAAGPLSSLPPPLSVRSLPPASSDPIGEDPESEVVPPPLADGEPPQPNARGAIIVAAAQSRTALPRVELGNMGDDPVCPSAL